MQEPVALVGLAANLPADAMYQVMDLDGGSSSNPKSYRIRFNAEDRPPVQAFWSVTAYTADDYLYAKPYALGSESDLLIDPDGSITLYIQQHEPEDDKLVPNWLPVPAGNFNITARFYWPKPALLNGEWKMPPVVKTSNGCCFSK